MYAVRHRGDGTYFAGACGLAAVWCRSAQDADRFVSAQDAWTAAYLVCLTTDPSDLVVVDLERPRERRAGEAT